MDFDYAITVRERLMGLKNFDILHQLRENPSVCFTTADHGIVASCVLRHDNSIGFVTVKEEHRGKGLGKLLVNKMTQEALCRSEFVHVVVKENNVISKNLFKGCGYVECSERIYYVICEYDE